MAPDSSVRAMAPDDAEWAERRASALTGDRRATMAGVAGFDCPRCGSAADEDLYGPCLRCRGELRAAYSGEARADVAAGDYEPKMNVTPNAVASKD